MVRFSTAVDSPKDTASLLQLERDYKLIREVGYLAIEPLINDPKYIEWKQIRSILDKHGLKISGLRTGFAYTRGGLSLTDPKKEVREKATKRIKDFVRVASTFNALVLIGLMQGKLKPGVDVKQGKEWIIESLIDCAEVAEDYGVMLAVEPLNRYELSYNNTIKEVIEMINKIGSEKVSLLIDTFHMNIEELSICDSILKARDYIGHVHFADSNRQAPGGGHLDFPMIVESLRKIRYRGYITVENQWKRPLNRADLSKAINYLKRLIT